MKYPNLFKEGNFGALSLKNRVIMPAMGTFLASADGEVTERQIAYFEARAKGGVGLIITEVTAVDYELGRCGPMHPRLDDVRYVPMMTRLADAVHKYGTRVFMQLSHAGRQTNASLTGGRQAVAPSAVPCEMIGETPRALTTEEIKELIAKYINGAVICQMAEIDGVELHGAHGYLINQFLSQKTNLRTDEYGGDFEGRMRFAKEIIEGIKRECGAAYPVIIRLSIDEFVDGGITPEAGVRIASYMEKIGADAINVSSGTYDSLQTLIEPTSFAQGWRVYLAEAVKKEVKIPVITAGVIREPDFAEAILAGNKADFVAIGRGQIADPEWCSKAASGRAAEIRKCISCLHCLDRVLARTHIGCAVNVKAGRELDFKELKKNGDRRKVVVIGGGPGGMEAARILALRDFNVLLLEKEARLGGQLNYGNRPVGKDKLTWFIEYMEQRFPQLNVDVRLGVAATAEMIRAENPHAVFVATGASPIIPNIEGVNGENVFDAHTALVNSDTIRGQSVAVIGAGMTGCEIAELLALNNNQVHLVELLPDVVTGAGPLDKMDMTQRLNEAGVDIHMEHKLLRIDGNKIDIEAVSTGEKRYIEVDKVVLSLGVASDRRLYDEIREAYDHVCLLGDAISPRKIVNAVKEGFEKAVLLE